MTVIKVPGSIATQKNSNQSPILATCDRRVFLATILAASAAQTAPFGAHAQAAGLTPYQQGQNLEYGLLPDGRIRKCNAAAQPNCVSTSSFSDMYSPPWLAGTSTASAAMEEFDAALLGISPDAELLENNISSSGAIYRKYKIANPAFEYDIVE